MNKKESMAKIKGQSGKSRESKVVSFRLKNDVHKALCKLAGGKTRLNGWLRRKAEDLV